MSDLLDVRQPHLLSPFNSMIMFDKAALFSQALFVEVSKLLLQDLKNSWEGAQSARIQFEGFKLFFDLEILGLI